MTDLYLVRHAQPLTGTRRILSRILFRILHKTSALSDIGRRQAELTARYLRRRPADRLFASPIPRALETGQLISAALGLELRAREDLKEQDRGPVLEKVKPAEMSKLYPADWQ